MKEGVENEKLCSLDMFSRFFQENRKRFLSFTCSYVRDKDDAEDILMESMIALWETKERWQAETNLPALLMTIVKNKALNYLDHQRVKLRVADELSRHYQHELDFRIFTLKACNPETIFQTEIQEIISSSLAKLPEQSRRVFVLSRFENKTNKQIAEMLDISVKTVEFHITKSLKLLKENLKDYFVMLFWF